jgi:hypothetical protein
MDLIKARRSHFLIGLSILFVILISSLGQPFITTLAGSSSISRSSSSINSQPTAKISLQSGSIIYQAQNTTVAFNNETGSISSITNDMTGQFTQLRQNYPLWTISTTNGTYTASSSNSFSFVETLSGELTMDWGIPRQNITGAEFTVQVIVKPDQSDGGIDMGINVTNYNPEITIVNVAFPYIAGFKTLGNSSSSDYLAIPRRDGLVIPNFQPTLGANETLRYAYPGTLSMQFFLIYDNNLGGFYEGVEDPGSNLKALEIQGSTYGESVSDPGGGFKFFWELYSSSIYPGNQFISNYSVTLAAFGARDSGTSSWQDGATLYRSWVLSQWYAEEGPLLTRSDIPKWFKDLGMVWQVNPPDNETPSIASTVNSIFPNETALMDLWGWNLWGFDQGYANYFPPLNGETTLADAINETHEQGDYAMMFFSGTLVDTNTTKDPQFSSIEQYLIMNQPGQLYLQTLPGNDLVAEGDPTTQWWQSQLVNFSVTAVKDYGADGVYLDGLAIQPPVINYRNSTYPTLSGSTWWQAYAEILTNITNSMRQYNPNAIVTSEGENEVYIPFLDAFWDNLDQDSPSNSGISQAIETPMFSFVYHEFTLVYGTPYSYDPFLVNGIEYHELFRYTLSKALTYGMIVRPDLPPYIQLTSSDETYLNQTIQLEQSYSQYLRFGEMLPGPAINSDITSYIFSANYTLNDVQSVSSGLFQASNGNDLLVISNPTTSDQNVSIQFYDGEFGSQQTLQSVQVCELGTGGNNCKVQANNSGDVNFSIGNLTNVVFSVNPSFVTSTTSASNSSSTVNSSATSVSKTENRESGFELYEIPTMFVVVVAAAISLFIYLGRNRKLRA